MPEDEIRIPIDGGDDSVGGSLAVPTMARGLVIFAHGSGSSRHSPRNRYVAQVLQEARYATLLMDLLTPSEDEEDRQTAEHRFDISLLARRLGETVDWVETQNVGELPVGLFGASTGAAATLVTSADKAARIAAVVSRGGRPDLAGPALRRVRAATLLIVGGADTVVLDLNRRALAEIPAAQKRLAIVPDATHLFEEPMALEAVAELAARWFADHVRGGP
jgi:putative phosphoribosyl transferase